MLCPLPLGINNFSALSLETTQVYLHADMRIKKEAMDRTRPSEAPEGAYQPNDALMAFLEAL